MSLEWKLPLLMTGVLTVVLATSLVLTYGTLARAAESSVRQHLGSAAPQIASSVDAAMVMRASRMRETAAQAAIRNALVRVQREPGGVLSDTAALMAEARAAMDRLRGATDSALAIELRTADGKRLALIGLDSLTAVRALSAENAVTPEWRVALDSFRSADSVIFGPMYVSGKRVLFWVVAPVAAPGSAKPIGYVAQQRQVVGPREATYSLQQLIGEEVAMYIRNDTGSFWTLAPGLPTAAPTRRETSGADMLDHMPGAGRMISAEAQVPGTPWLVVLQSPLRAAHARARRTLLTLALLSLLLIALGAAISWMISRRITQPLASLTTAAEAMARGDYTTRVEHRSGDEIGRLAASFNQMADEVDSAHQELACQVEEAQASAEELEVTNQQLQEAMTEVEQAREEADRANRAKGDFLAVMSHELRTPLNAIGGYAQLLELGIHGPVTETQRDALARIARSQGHLLRLITDVLNFAKIDAGQMQYEITDVSIDEALAGLEAMVAPQVRAKRLTFTYVTCDQPLIARADREKLPQIVLNLVTNAIKFTPDGGEVIVECDFVDDRVRVRVRDTGIGIPAERLPFIFDPFVQVDRALHRPNEGVGLGLAISRDLARGMGGDVTVESTVAEGSVFTLTLPKGEGSELQGRGASGEGRGPLDMAFRPADT